jgi:hypothetical protein
MNAGGEKMQREEANDASEIGFKFSNCVFLSPAYFPQFLCLAQQTRRHRRARGGRHGLALLHSRNRLLPLQYNLGADKRRSAPGFPIKFGVILEFGDFADSEVERSKCARRILRPTVPGRTDLCARRAICKIYISGPFAPKSAIA